MSECVMNETKIMVGGNLDKPAAITYLTGKLSGDTEAIKVRRLNVINVLFNFGIFFKN